MERQQTLESLVTNFLNRRASRRGVIEGVAILGIGGTAVSWLRSLRTANAAPSADCGEPALEKPCYQGVIENVFQLGSFVYQPGAGSDNGTFDPEDKILDRVVGGNFTVELKTGQRFDLKTDESGWAKDAQGKEEIHVVTGSDKPGIEIVRLPDLNGNEQSYYATRATITTYRKTEAGLVPHEQFTGLLPFYKQGLNYDPDFCGRVWVIGLDIRNIPQNLRSRVEDKPAKSPKKVHPLVKKA